MVRAQSAAGSWPTKEPSVREQSCDLSLVLGGLALFSSAPGCLKPVRSPSFLLIELLLSVRDEVERNPVRRIAN